MIPTSTLMVVIIRNPLLKETGARFSLVISQARERCGMHEKKKPIDKYPLLYMTLPAKALKIAMMTRGNSKKVTELGHR